MLLRHKSHFLVLIYIYDKSIWLAHCIMIRLTSKFGRVFESAYNIWSTFWVIEMFYFMHIKILLLILKIIKWVLLIVAYNIYIVETFFLDLFLFAFFLEIFLVVFLNLLDFIKSYLKIFWLLIYLLKLYFKFNLAANCFFY
jgi:hypothetical protein